MLNLMHISFIEGCVTQGEITTLSQACTCSVVQYRCAAVEA